MVKNHVRIELLDCEVWKKYKDDKGIVWLWDSGSCLTPGEWDSPFGCQKGPVTPTAHPLLLTSPSLHPSPSPANHLITQTEFRLKSFNLNPTWRHNTSIYIHNK